MSGRKSKITSKDHLSKGDGSVEGAVEGDVLVPGGFKKLFKTDEDAERLKMNIGHLGIDERQYVKFSHRIARRLLRDDAYLDKLADALEGVSVSSTDESSSSMYESSSEEDSDSDEDESGSEEDSDESEDVSGDESEDAEADSLEGDGEQKISDLNLDELKKAKPPKKVKPPK